MRAEEDRWHGTPKALASKIEATATELLELLGMADEILQSEDMPQPWEQWDRAVQLGQDAWSELAEGGDVRVGVLAVARALRKSGLDSWPRETADKA